METTRSTCSIAATKRSPPEEDVGRFAGTGAPTNAGGAGAGGYPAPAAPIEGGSGCALAA